MTDTKSKTTKPVPFEPTEAMLIAARDWSSKKYGIPIGNDAARGCWQAMVEAANAEQSPTTEELDQCQTCQGSGEVFVRRDSRRRIDYIDGSPTGEIARCDMCDGEGVRS